MSVAYDQFLASKAPSLAGSGFLSDGRAEHLFPVQTKIVDWACRRGKAAIFADCGMGKTVMQLDWARQVNEQCGGVDSHGGGVLILAPLAVAQQTVREGGRFGIDLAYARAPEERTTDIVITNYEHLEKWAKVEFSGVVLDESSILKSYDGKTRTAIIEAFSQTCYRLACTATPAPNDFMELGNHAEFLGVMSRVEMLSQFFVHDGGDTSAWRLKGHAQDAFWRWVCSWALMVRKPSDLGFSDDGFVLPPMSMNEHIIPADQRAVFASGRLFTAEATDLVSRRNARKESLADRVRLAAEIVAAKPDEPWLLWCNLNAEADALEAAIPGAVQVAGSNTLEEKSERMLGFAEGRIRVLITKPRIAGFGMNWQHCANVVFVGLSDSYEEMYQALRRCWRFGQKNPVGCHIVIAETEGAVLRNVQRKEADARHMADAMVKEMRVIQGVAATERQRDDYNTHHSRGEGWTMFLGDCVDLARELPDHCIDYTIFSPPFASLYTYSNSERDMGNCRSHDEFYEHFKYLVPELLRLTRPGRLLSFHCMNLPTSKVRDGVIGITDFRGELIRLFIEAGWIFHSEVCIWKDPVTAMQRTKALGLLYKQLKKDSAMSRQGIPDYLVTMRAPGANPAPVTKDPESFPVHLWQNYASPVWMDINPSKTLQSMREEEDERHICPLQLEVIERAVRLWTNPGDLVLSPFAGIGSEGHVSLEMKRRFVGFELKRAYFDVARKNLERAAAATNQQLAMFAEGASTAPTNEMIEGA